MRALRRSNHLWSRFKPDFEPVSSLWMWVLLHVVKDTSTNQICQIGQDWTRISVTKVYILSVYVHVRARYARESVQPLCLMAARSKPFWKDAHQLQGRHNCSSNQYYSFIMSLKGDGEKNNNFCTFARRVTQRMTVAIRQGNGDFSVISLSLWLCHLMSRAVQTAQSMAPRDASWRNDFFFYVAGCLEVSSAQPPSR